MNVDTIEELALVASVAVLAIVAVTGAAWLHRLETSLEARGKTDKPRIRLGCRG